MWSALNWKKEKRMEWTVETVRVDTLEEFCWRRNQKYGVGAGQVCKSETQFLADRIDPIEREMLKAWRWVKFRRKSWNR